MRFLIALLLLSSSFLACKVEVQALKNKNVNGGRDLSVFQIYASKYCDLRNEDDTQSMRIDCALLKSFLEPGAEGCNERDGFAPYAATFPDKTLSLRVCRDLANAARQDQERVTFLVFGDVGAGQAPEEGAEQLRVAKAMTGVCPPRSLTAPAADGSPRCDFALIVGDLIYPSGIESVWDPLLGSRFEDAYRHFGTFDFFLVPGNHDYLGSITAQLEYSYFSDRWRMPARHYALPDLPSWLNIYGLDTSGLVNDEDLPKSSDTSEEQLEDLRAKFCGKDGWRLLFGHHPPFSSGKHGGVEAMGIRLGHLAAECPFDLYMAGHDHHQEHIQTELFDVLIQGAGGAEVKDVTQHPEPQVGRLGDDLAATYQQMFARTAHGFAVVDATPEVLDVRFYDVSRWNYEAGVFTDPISHTQFIYHCRIARDAENHACVPVDDAPVE